MKTYKGLLNSLPENGIFVFGSNTQGRHGAGAALYAKNNFGASYGNPKGLQGRSYAIITKDLTKTTHPSISEKMIVKQIKDLYEYARNNPSKEFYIAYRGTGFNLNGYSNEDMAKMFVCQEIPQNIVFEEEFFKLIRNL